MKEHPTIDFSDYIIKGSLTNFVYDGQCEGSRAVYIYGLIKQAKQKEKIIDTILDKFLDKKHDWYGLDQMSDIAMMLAKKGNQKARTVIQQRFQKNLLPDFEFCGQDALIELEGMEGMEGLKQAAELIGKKLLADPEDYEESWRVDNYQKKHKAIDVYGELKKAGAKNKFILAYYNSIKKHKFDLPKGRRKVVRFTYELVKEKIEANKFRFINEERAKDLTNQEVEKLANEFLNEKDKARKEMYLRFFAKRKFPYDYKPLIEIAKGKNKKGERQIEFAVDALKYFSVTDIRKLAMDKLKNAKGVEVADYLNLLVSNYKKDDHKLLNAIVDKSDNYDYIHSIVNGFIDIYDANPTKDCKQPLEKIYDKLNCGMHRIDVVRILSFNDVLSDKIKQELKHDSYEDIRKKAKELNF